jgi:hypothetical protein
MKINPSLTIAQTLPPKPVIHISELYGRARSRATAYRIMSSLERIGFVERKGGGYFALRDSLFQPFHVWPHLVPSLQALSQARYFGKTYKKGDVKVASEILEGMVTLDYRAYELTRLQAPGRLFVYVDDLDLAAKRLLDAGFSEGKRGKVVILPALGEFGNEIERVYLDCLAFGGRSSLDAIAIELKHGHKLVNRGAFPVHLVAKVTGDLSGPNGH